MRKWIERLPLQYRILCRVFVLRVIDLESLSVQADIPRYLGQFGGVLLMLGFVHTMFVYGMTDAQPWFVEQYLIRTSILVAGFVTLVCWDGMFPDHRDVMVLGTLPVRPATVLRAKISATAGLVMLAMLLLNAGPGLVGPLVLAIRHRTGWGLLQAAAAYWTTMAAVSLFPYAAAHTVQGLLGLLLPRRIFVRISAGMQLVALVALLTLYFLTPAIHRPQDLLKLDRHEWLAWSPVYCFSAVFNQVNSSLPHELAWLTQRAWTLLGFAMVGATVSLLVGYLRTMKQIAEQQELVLARSTKRHVPDEGVRAAMTTFNIKSLLRSRQHRSIYAFYCSLVLALGLSCVRNAGLKSAVTSEFMGSTVLMMGLAVIGLRGVSSLPVSLGANWVMRLTQFGENKLYLSATRMFTFLFAVLPTWIFSAALASVYRPFGPSLVHLAMLAVVGWLAVELSLVNARKVPFACSFLPGKSNIQARFWTFIIGMVPLTLLWGVYEGKLLQQHAFWFAVCVAGLAMAAAALSIWNERMSKDVVLEFEETELEVMTTLGLGMASRSL